MKTKHFHSFLTIIAILCMLAIPLQPAQASGATIYVPDNYSTIQAALNAANPGDTVFVRAGTYYEHVVVSKSLTLQGEDKTTTIIDGSGSGYGIHLPSTDYVTISGFTVRNCRSAVFFQSGANYNTVTNAIAANSEYGFDNGDTGNNHNTYQNVEAYGITQLGLSAYAGSNYTTVIDSNFHDNYIGIGMGWSSNWSVSGTTMENNTYGLGIDAADYGVVRNNIITNNSLYGIIFNGPHERYNLITGNKISGNDSGLQFRCTARFNTITENEISDNTAYGVFLLRNNTCPNYGNIFYHNTFTNNTVNAQDDEERYGGNTWDNGYPSGGNIWDNYTGVDLFSGASQNVPGFDGIGDTPYVIRAGLDVDHYPIVSHQPPSDECLNQPPSGLVAWWPGDNTTDDIIGGHNAELRNGATYAIGFAGQAFSLDGINDFVNVADASAFNFGTSDFTIDLWVNFNSTSGEQIMVEKYIETEDNATRSGWTLTKMAGNSIRLHTGSVYGGVVESPAQTIPENTWVYVALRRSGDNFSIFMNGVEIASGTYAVNVNSTSSLKFGHRGNPDDTPGSVDGRGFYLNGRMDDVVIYNHALTDAELYQRYYYGIYGKSYCQPEPPSDTTPPTITPTVDGTLGSNGWYTSNVAVTWTMEDPESGIASSSGCDPTTLNADTLAETLTCSATNGAGLTNSESVTVKIDKIAPAITWVSDINDGDSYYFGSVPPEPTCTASDNLSGVDGSCIVSGYATTVGTLTLTATAQDNAGNQATGTRGYTVLPWTLKGFYQPVDMNGVFNIAKNGSTIPLKFEIFAGATELTDTAYIKSLNIGLTACYADAPTDAIELTATGGTSLRYDPIAGQFIYNWKTPNTAGKCYRVTLTTIDGSTLVAYFNLK